MNDASLEHLLSVHYRFFDKAVARVSKCRAGAELLPVHHDDFELLGGGGVV